jgi:hypothetical protein
LKKNSAPALNRLKSRAFRRFISGITGAEQGITDDKTATIIGNISDKIATIRDLAHNSRSAAFTGALVELPCCAHLGR